MVSVVADTRVKLAKFELLAIAEYAPIEHA
jgi:hypothetical protein